MIETAAIYAFIIANEAIILLAIQVLIVLCLLICVLAIEVAVAYLLSKALRALIALSATIAGTLRHVLFGVPKYDVQANPEANVPAEPPLDLEADLLEEPPEYIDADKYQPEYEPPPYSGKASSMNIVYTIRKKWGAYQHEKQISEIFDLPAYDEADLEENISINPGRN